MNCNAAWGWKRKSSWQSPSRSKRLARRANRSGSHPPAIRSRSKVGILGLRDRKQVVAEMVAVVFRADRFPPRILASAPALGRVHGLVEGALILDLDEGFEEPAVCRHLEALRHMQLFRMRGAEHVDVARRARGDADGIDDEFAVLVMADR